MNEKDMILETEKSPPLSSPTWHDVESVHSTLGPKANGFAILNVQGIGYVQAAGTNKKMTVEFRLKQPHHKFRHSVIGMPDNHPTETTVKTVAGQIKLMTNEILNLQDALRIFRSFFENAIVPQEFSQRDTTQMFK